MHGGRSDLRNRAQDRKFASGGGGKGAANQSALKLRPDLHRLSNGFFMKDTPAPAIGA